jgi:hypothetical protein
MYGWLLLVPNPATILSFFSLEPPCTLCLARVLCNAFASTYLPIICQGSVALRAIVMMIWCLKRLTLKERQQVVEKQQKCYIFVENRKNKKLRPTT